VKKELRPEVVETMPKLVEKQTPPVERMPITGLEGKTDPTKDVRLKIPPKMYAVAPVGKVESFAALTTQIDSKLAPFVPMLTEGAEVNLTLAGELKVLQGYINFKGKGTLKRCADGRFSFVFDLYGEGGADLGPNAGDFGVVIRAGLFNKLKVSVDHKDAGVAFFLARIALEKQLRSRSSGFGVTGDALVTMIAGDDDGFSGRLEKALAVMTELPDYDDQKYEMDEAYKQKVDEARKDAGLIKVSKESGLVAAFKVKLGDFLLFGSETKNYTLTETELMKQTEIIDLNPFVYMGNSDPKDPNRLNEVTDMVPVGEKKTFDVIEFSAKSGFFAGNLKELTQRDAEGPPVINVGLKAVIPGSVGVSTVVDNAAAAIAALNSRFNDEKKQDALWGTTLPKGYLREGLAPALAMAGVDGKIEISAALKRDAAGEWSMVVTVKVIDQKSVGLATVDHAQSSVIFDGKLGKDGKPSTHPMDDYHTPESLAALKKRHDKSALAKNNKYERWNQKHG
jgi:hypothetical protein